MTILFIPHLALQIYSLNGVEGEIWGLNTNGKYEKLNEIQDFQ